MAILMQAPSTQSTHAIRQPARYNPRGKVAHVEQVLGESGRARRILAQEDTLATARSDRRLDLGRGISWDAVAEARDDRGWQASVVSAGWFD